MTRAKIRSANAFKFKAFRNWMQKQTEDVQFERGNSRLCPLAQWSGLSVTNVYARHPMGDNKFELPNWAMAFVSQFDAPGHKVHQYATCREIMLIIENISP